MAKQYKAHSSPWVLIVPLVIAIVVVVSAAYLSQRAAYTRSKASFDPVQACVDTCNKEYRKNVIKDPAACALDCPVVVAGDMTCKEFCQENVKQIVAPPHNNPSGTPKPGTSSRQQCNKQCESWIGDPCAAKGAVCKDALGVPKDQAKLQCAAACELVKNEEKTCDEAMTADSLSSVNAQYRPKVLNNCKNYFE